MGFARLFSVTILLLSSYGLWAQCGVTVEAGEDVYLCQPPTPTQLQGEINGDYLSFMWSPTAGMSGSNTLNPIVNVQQTTKYFLKAIVPDLSNNLIINGDFEAGNTGFYSDYIYSPGDLVPEGLYDVLANPQNSHPGFAPCSDHTSGTGNMMAVNGAGVPNQNVWCQTVSVTPNTTYVFSAWVTTLVATSPALLQFSINGTTIGPIFSAPSSNCTWINFFTTWNSGSSSSATICVVNQNTVLGGNDFALDDIVFAPTCEVTDSVTVHVVPVVAVANPPSSTIPCEGFDITLNGAGSTTGPNVTYLWETPNGNIVSGATTLNPVVDAAGQYTLTVSVDNNGVVCEKTTTVNVIQNNALIAWITNPAPLGCGSDSTILAGNSTQSSQSSYQWSTFNGNIVSGADTKFAVVDAPGTYTLVVTNVNTGCTATADVTVTVANNPPAAMAATPDSISCYTPSAVLSGTGSSTGSNIQYAWTASPGLILSGQNNIQASAGAAGTYILAVTNSTNNCTTYDTVVVTGDLTAPTVAIDTPATLNCFSDTLQLAGNVSPAGATFSWSTVGGQFAAGDSTLSPAINAAGQYILSAINLATGCPAADTVVVTIDTVSPLAVVLPADTLTCQNPQQTLSGTGSSSGPNFSYQWITGNGNFVSGDTTLNPIVNAPAWYLLSVRNTANGCVDTDSVLVPADTNAIKAVANAPDTLTCIVDSVLLNANGSSSIPGLIYTWTTANGLILSGMQTPAPVVGASGLYALSISNPSNGCTATDTVAVQLNNALPQLDIDSVPLITCIQPVVGVTAYNTTPGPHTYQWTTAGGNILTGADSLHITVNQPGWYVLQALNNANGCTYTDSVEVQLAIGTPVAESATPGGLNCAVTELTLSAAGSTTGANYTMNWTASQGGNIVAGAQTANPTVDEPGLYTLLVTNVANGCTDVDSVWVQENAVLPPADILPANMLTCSLPTQLIQANAGVPDSNLVYMWFFQQQMVSDSNSAIVSAAGAYTVMVTDTANQCVQTDTILITADQAPPQLNPGIPAVLNCTVSTVSLPLQFSPGNLTFDWQTTDGHFVSSAQIAEPVVDEPGQYAVTAVNPQNGCTQSAQVQVLQDTAAPLAEAGIPFTLTCIVIQNNLQGTANPGTTTTWSTPDGNIVSGGQTTTPLVDAPGSYMLTVTNPVNGCSSQDSVTIPEDITEPTVDAGADDTLSCALPSLFLNGSSDEPAVSWSALNGGNILTGQLTLFPEVNAAGLYVLQAVNPLNGCEATDTVSILADDQAPVLQIAAPPTLTCEQTQAELSATASSGPQFLYMWTTTDGQLTGGVQTLNPTVGAAGAYILLVTNTSNGCTETGSVTVPIDTVAPQADAGAAEDLTCAVFTVVLSGSTNAGNASYAWTGPAGGIQQGANTTSPVVNAAGWYVLEVTDNQNGCKGLDSVQVMLDTVHPVLSIAAPEALTCERTEVTLQAGANAPSGFAAGWSTTGGNIVSGVNGLTPVVDAPGVYSLFVVNDINGCTALASTTVTEDIAPPLADAGARDTLTCSVTQLSLDGNGSSTGTGIGYQWSAFGGGQIVSGAQSLQPVVNAAGSYVLAVKRADNGCSASDTTQVTAFVTPPAPAIAPPAILTCETDTISVNASVTTLPGGTPFTATWTTSGGNIAGYNDSLTPLADQPGTYQLLVVRDDNGCSATASVVVAEDVQKPVLVMGPDALLYCSQPTAALSVTGQPANLAYLWSTTDGNLVSGATSATPLVDAEGTYTVVATNPANGCTAVDFANAEAVPLPEFLPVVVQPSCLQPKGGIEFDSLAGGMLPFRFSINGGQQFDSHSAFAGLQAGTYELVLEDALGCTATAEVLLIAPPVATLSVQDVYLVPLGDEVQLQPVTNLAPANLLTWVWSPATGLSCADCPEPIASPGQTTQYTVSVADTNGCRAEARVLVRVDRRRRLFAPNVITPDASDNNRFILYGKGVEIVENLQIFDRWGNMAFNASNLGIGDESAGWDGSFQNQPVNPGVFVWKAKVRFDDGVTEVFAGDVTVVR